MGIGILQQDMERKGLARIVEKRDNCTNYKKEGKRENGGL